MKVYKYKTVVTFDSVHEYMDREIEEIWIPGLDVCFNSEGFAFKSKKPRGENTKEIEVSGEHINWIHNYMNAKSYLDELTKLFFKE